jgi:hypothetical protein
MDLAQTLTDAVVGVTKRWCQQRKAEERHRTAELRRRSVLTRSRPRASVRDVIRANLDAAVNTVSGGGRHRYSLRQLFYAVRPFVLRAVGEEPSYDYFCQLVTEREAELGHDLPGIYRDVRGTLYHPHRRETIPLGTLAAEEYCRPEWTFNKVLYCEKEGFFPILIDARWPEKHDCALLTSKGFASRAARDLLDALGDTTEEIQFFCVHDADASGTLIYQSLQQETAARPARRVRVVNLGLDPAEAVALRLPVEAVGRGRRERPVAAYVEEEWREWLQSRRVELNAMTTPQFLDWLDRKFADYAGKVLPPADVLQSRLESAVRSDLARRITERVLEEARIGDQVDEAMAGGQAVLKRQAKGLRSRVRQLCKRSPEEPWWSWITLEAIRVLEKIS